jgi:hypothetical protein
VGGVLYLGVLAGLLLLVIEGEGPQSPKEWLAVIGVLVILFFAIAEAEGSGGSYRSRGSRGRAEGAHAAYVVLIASWFSLLNVLDYRAGLQRLGVPEALSWVLAPVTLVVLFGASLLGWYVSDEEGLSLAKRAAPWAVWLAILFLYPVIAYGLEAFT